MKRSDIDAVKTYLQDLTGTLGKVASISTQVSDLQRFHANRLTEINTLAAQVQALADCVRHITGKEIQKRNNVAPTKRKTVQPTPVQQVLPIQNDATTTTKQSNVVEIVTDGQTSSGWNGSAFFKLADSPLNIHIHQWAIKQSQVRDGKLVLQVSRKYLQKSSNPDLQRLGNS